MSKIVILESLAVSDEKMRALKVPFEAQGHVFEEYARSADTQTLIRQAQDADALILANMPLRGEVIRACGKLKYIDVAFTGVDHVDLAAAREMGVKVSNASGYSNEAVAELALGMALSLSRNLTAVEEHCRQGKTKDGLMGFELKGKTVGIIGMGHIGRRSAELFRTLGCTILAQNRSIHSDFPDYVTQVSQEELLKRADVVLLHCPLNDSTRGMINREKLAMMKHTAMLINVARGPVVVARDLQEALNNGVIAAAGVDVFDAEPPLSPDEPLLHCKNCLVTPHVAFASKESMELRADIVFDNLTSWLAGSQKNVIL